MSRRKGEMSNGSIYQGWPHQVALPNNRVSTENKAIRSFCEGLSLCDRGHTFVSDAGEYINVFCFGDPEHAQRFASEFGGEMIHPKDRPRWPRRKPRRC